MGKMMQTGDSGSCGVRADSFDYLVFGHDSHINTVTTIIPTAAPTM